MGLTKWNDILNKPKGVDNIEEIMLEISDLSASVLSISEDVGEIELSISDLSASVLSISEDVGEIALDVSQLSATVLSISGEIADIKTIDDAHNENFMQVNDTWQIPADVWAHKLILVEMRRQGIGGYLMVEKSGVNAFDVGLKISAVSGQYYDFTISSTGLLTLKSKSADINDPFVQVFGIL